jgi:nucleoside-diphosphate-sugar epimerase
VHLQKKILITGSTGFIGKNLIKNIPKLHKLYCISRKKIISKNINYIQANLFNKRRVEQILKELKPDYLIHLAWEAKPKKYLHAKSNIKWVEASKNIFLHFCKNKGKKAILIGSILENDLNSKFFYEKPINARLKKGKNLYNISKIKFYNQAKIISKRYNVKFVWARIAWLYGPYENKQRLIPKLIYSLKNQKKMEISNPMNSINILHVKDVVNLIYLFLFNKIYGVVNLANSNTFRIIDIVNLLIKIMKKNKNKLTFSQNNNPINFFVITKKIILMKYKFKYNLVTGLKSLIM